MKIARSTAAAEQEAHDQTAAFKAALRAIKAPLLLEDAGVADRERAVIINAATVLLRQHVGSGTARALFIVGNPWDWYHYDLALTLPPWLRTSAMQLLAPGQACSAWGWMRDALLRVNESDDDHVSADLAMASFVHAHFSDHVAVSVVDACLPGSEVLPDPDFLDGFDVVYDSSQASSYPYAKPRPENASAVGDLSPTRDQLRVALQGTRAAVWPHPQLNFNANKSRLPLLLRSRNIPAAPTFDVAFESHGDARQLARDTMARAAVLGWPAAFVKPHDSSFMDDVSKVQLTGTQEVVDRAETRLADDIEYLRDTKGSSGLAVQRYLPSVATRWEVRLFFVGGEFVWAIGNKVDATRLGEHRNYFYWDTFDYDGSGLDSSVLRLRDLLEPLARRALDAVVAELPAEVLRTTLQRGEPPPVARVDLACCLEASEDAALAADSAGWFVNELETAPDSCMTYFKRHLVNTIDKSPPYHSDARMRRMVARAAAAWYPLAETVAVEYARFAVRAAQRHKERNTVAVGLKRLRCALEVG